MTIFCFENCFKMSAFNCNKIVSKHSVPTPKFSYFLALYIFCCFECISFSFLSNLLTIDLITIGVRWKIK